jgi:hypothetical protein
VLGARVERDGRWRAPALTPKRRADGDADGDLDEHTQIVSDPLRLNTPARVVRFCMRSAVETAVDTYIRALSENDPGVKLRARTANFDLCLQRRPFFARVGE